MELGSSIVKKTGKILATKLNQQKQKHAEHVFQVVRSYSLIPIPLLLLIWPPVPEVLAGEVKINENMLLSDVNYLVVDL